MKTSYIRPTIQKLLSKTSGYMIQLCDGNFNTKVSIFFLCPCCANALLLSDSQQSQQGRAEKNMGYKYSYPTYNLTYNYP